LSIFDGKNARGTWKLVLDDLAPYDTGKLASWSLIIDSGTNIASATSTNFTTEAVPSFGIKEMPSAPVDNDNNRMTGWQVWCVF